MTRVLFLDKSPTPPAGTRHDPTTNPYSPPKRRHTAATAMTVVINARIRYSITALCIII